MELVAGDIKKGVCKGHRVDLEGGVQHLGFSTHMVYMMLYVML